MKSKLLKATSLLLAVMLLAGALAGCGGTDTTAGGNTTNATQQGGSTTAAQQGGSTTPAAPVIITLAQQTDVTSFDPHDQNDTGSSTVIRHIYDPLVRADADNSIIPALAESWEFPDDSTIRFNLRQGVVYHNGTPFTSADVKFSLDRQKASSKQGTMIAAYESCEIVDDFTVLVHLNQPATPVLLAALTRHGASIVCKSYTEETEAAGKTLNEAPMGTGPYKFVSFQSNDRTVLEANHAYYQEIKNDGIIVRCIADPTARTIALETGEVDVLLDVGAVDANRIRDNAALALDEFLSARFEYMGFNTTKAPYNDIRVRQALMHLVNRDDIIKVAVNGEGDPLFTGLAAGASGYTADVTKYPYDVEKAKALLAEAGYADGFDAVYVCSLEQHQKIGQVLQASFAQANVRLTIESMESAALYDYVDAKMHDIGGLGRISSSPDPDVSLAQMYHSASTGVAANIWGLNDPKADALIEGARIEPDPAKRQAMYTELLQFVSEEAIINPFYTVRGFIARKANLEGFKIYPLGVHMFHTLYFS